MKSKPIQKYRWRCDWREVHGSFHGDNEYCFAKGRFVKNLETAVKRGIEHSETHAHRGNWSNDHTTTWIERKTPSGKIESVLSPHFPNSPRIAYCDEYEDERGAK